jgi:hypothetical protein
MLYIFMHEGLWHSDTSYSLSMLESVLDQRVPKGVGT